MSATIPDQGLCGTCEETVRLRRDGTLYKHSKPYDPDGPIVGTITGSGTVWHNDCAGSGELPAVRREMTFARWLHAHVARRDARGNPVTYLAQYLFQPCSRTPAKGPGEVTWSSPGELQLLHLQPGVNDWLGAYIDQAAAEYERYRVAGVR